MLIIEVEVGKAWGFSYGFEDLLYLEVSIPHQSHVEGFDITICH